MPSFSNIRRVPFTASQMFALVSDVEAYPEFLPLCESLAVLARRTEGDTTILDARMGVGYRAIRETFVSRVTLMPGGGVPAILVEYRDGPFRRLQNRWRFIPAAGSPDGAVQGAACDIDFYVDYEFRSPMLALLMGAVFDRAFRQFAGAFEDRARRVYGAASATTPNRTSSA